MITTLFVTREEFAARRRTAQDESVAILVHDVPEAISTQQVTDDLLNSMELVYAATYHDENADGTPQMPANVVPKVNNMLSHATPTSDVTATALAISNLLINEATMQAAVDDEDDLFMEWVTMHDDAVRVEHADTDGQVRPIGDKFDVSGIEMAFPGDIAAPIELWINCRCVLRPTYPPEFHGRETVEMSDELAISEKPWDGSASRFTPEQWRTSTVLHVCDGLEKSCHKLPIREPGGALSRAAVHNAAARVNQVDAPPDKKASAKRALRGAYRQLGEDPPDVLKATAQDLQVFVPAEMRDPDEELEIRQGEPYPKPDDKNLSDDQLQALAGLVPWHGVLAPEGTNSGDGRQFAADALSWRDLPLPLTYQKASASGHDGSITVGSIENIDRKDGLILADGFLLSTPEADEVVGLIAHFGKYGVSVDADDTEFEFDEEASATTFTKARICSASLVAIPAFAEAYVTLGHWSEDESQMAAGEDTTEFVNTEDGPGWLTHPVDTDRLRDYWVRGPGAAKIGWGTKGDFNRCRLHLAKYIKPQHLAGYCANRHYDALGFWPGRPVSGDTDQFDGEHGPALSLVSSAAIKAPAAWFADPNLSEPTHLTVTEDGRVYGHIAQWGVCHIGIDKVCTTAPTSPSDYMYYCSGRVLLDDESTALTGVISVGGGHANGNLNAAAAIAHYDNTSTAVADVTVGEDEHGIWCAGWMRPGSTEQDRYVLRASDVSGDWRDIAGSLELVAVLAVNVNGFPVKVATKGGEMVTLVAAGVIHPEPSESPEDRLAAAIVRAMEQAERNRKKRATAMTNLRAKYAEVHDGM